MKLRLSPQAEADIETITSRIAGDSPSAASAWLENINGQCNLLAEMPRIGRLQEEVRPGMRLWPVANYLILYREAAEGVEIIRVVHGARRWQDLL